MYLLRRVPAGSHLTVPAPSSIYISVNMDDIQEKKIGDLTIRIDRLLCVGFGDCVEHAPDAFELDAEEIAVFKENGDEAGGGTVRDRLIEACRLCPVDALEVVDAEGNALVP